jgi:hypothetical protein
MGLLITYRHVFKQSNFQDVTSAIVETFVMEEAVKLEKRKVLAETTLPAM